MTDPTTTFEPTTVPTVPPELSALSARLHEDIESIVIVSWEQSTFATVYVEFSVDDGVWLTSPPRDVPAGPHEELLLGVPYDMEVTWRIVAESVAGSATTPDQQITTGEFPSAIGAPELVEGDPSAWDPDTSYVFMSITEYGGSFLGDPWWTVILDRQGRTVWATETPNGRVTMHPRLNAAGDSLMIDHNSYWGAFDGGENSTVREVKIDGTVVQTWDMPGLHHPYVQLPDGSMAWGALTNNYGTEYVIVQDPSGENTVLFDCEAWLDAIGQYGYCASNTLSYDPLTNHFLFSLFSTDTMIEIDAATGEPTRWFGNVVGSWDFDPPSSQFYYQHGGYFTPTGTLLVSSESVGPETVVREYEVDEGSETLVEVFNFAVGDGIHGNDMGEAHRLGNGNTLHNYGTYPRLREATPDGTVVWDVAWPYNDIGRSVPIGDLYVFAPPRL